MYLTLLLCGIVMMIATLYAICDSVETTRNTKKWRETARSRRAGGSRSPTRRGCAPDDRLVSTRRH